MSVGAGYVLGRQYASREIDKLKRDNERLQEKLNEANEVIKWYAQPDTGSAKDYIKKWGVK